MERGCHRHGEQRLGPRRICQKIKTRSSPLRGSAEYEHRQRTSRAARVQKSIKRSLLGTGSSDSGLRGFAPFGAGASEKLSTEEVQRVGATIRMAAGPTLSAKLRFCPGFALNHDIAYKHVGEEDIRDTANAQAKQFLIKGRQVRASVESSPSRRRACACFYKILESMKACRCEGKDFESCARGLTMYRLPEWEQMCRVGIDSGEIKWNHSELERMGLEATDTGVIELEGATPRLEEARAEDIDDRRTHREHRKRSRQGRQSAPRPPPQPQAEPLPPAKRARDDVAAETTENENDKRQDAEMAEDGTAAAAADGDL